MKDTDRFEILSDRKIVLDYKTTLAWMQEPLEGYYTFDEACNLKINFDGANNWRLPTIEELIGIVNYKKVTKYRKLSYACYKEFNFSKGTCFWTGMAYKNNSENAWNVNFINGGLHIDLKASEFSVILVRDL